MTPTVNNLPLKIIHNFPYSSTATLDEKKNVVTNYLLDIQSRGFGGIVNNISTRNYLQNPEEHEVFAFVTDECERLGLRLWIYDEDGYPSGAAGGLTIAENPEFEATAGVMVKESIGAGENKVIDLPRGHQHFLYAAVYSCDGEGKLITENIRATMEMLLSHGVGQRVIVHCPEAGFCLSAGSFREGTTVKSPLRLRQKPASGQWTITR